MKRGEPTNAEVAGLLRQLATALTLEGESRFKIKAYRRAAETLETLDRSVAELVASGDDITELPGVGDAIAAKIAEIVNSGQLRTLDKKLAALSPEIAELASRPRLDPKVVKRVYKKLGISTLAELGEGLESGRIQEALGAGVAFQIQRGLDDRPRMLLYQALPIADAIEAHLRKGPRLLHLSRTGSLRRLEETVGDLNFLISSQSAKASFDHFEKFGSVQSRVDIDRSTSKFQLSSGISVALNWTRAGSWGFALLNSTGSKNHIDEVKRHAKANKRTFSLASLKRAKLDLADESAIYRSFDLEPIPPELREDRGEITAASQGKLPELVTIEDLRGDLHMHTTASDGRNTLKEMADAAKARGYSYIAITDHSQSLKITNGLTERRLLAHIKAIDKLNAKLRGFTILKSAEVDILEDGSLDYSDDMLKELDLTICSIHSRFALNREQQTARIMRAMDNPYFNILGHATGRLLLKREGYEIDFERILKHARANSCFFEINSSPDRLDLSDENAKLVKDGGDMLAVNTDAHSIRELDFMEAGIRQARRAWLEPADVLNCLPLSKLLKKLHK